MILKDPEEALKELPIAKYELFSLNSPSAEVSVNGRVPTRRLSGLLTTKRLPPKTRADVET